jgi:hypothetical protein
MSERKVRPNGWRGGLEEASTRRGGSITLVACLMLAVLLLSGCGPACPEGGQERTGSIRAATRAMARSIVDFRPFSYRIVWDKGGEK